MISGRVAGSPTAVADPWREVLSPSGWDHLILPERLVKELKAVPKLFRDRMPEGVWLIFEGPAGTGKSSVAQTLAHELGLTPLHADAATWSGDTSERLDGLFEPLAGQSAVLVVDRADALLTGDAGGVSRLRHWRSELPSVVVFCVESRRGVPVAALEAFDRLLVFPEPDAAARRAIWQGALPLDAPLDTDAIDRLAQAFALTGKEIAGCVVAAETRCAQDQHPLSEALLAEAVLEAHPDRVGAEEAAPVEAGPGRRRRWRASRRADAD